MGVDFISQDIRTKPDRMKQEEFLIILLERVTKYTFEHILCNRFRALLEVLITNKCDNTNIC